MKRVFPPERMRAIVGLARERIRKLDDFVGFAAPFFGDELDWEPMLEGTRIKGRSRDDIVAVLRRFIEEIETDPVGRAFDIAGLEAFLSAFQVRCEWKPRELFPLLRIAVTARKASPPLAETMAACGKDRVRSRVRRLAALIESGPEF